MVPLKALGENSTMLSSWLLLFFVIDSIPWLIDLSMFYLCTLKLWTTTVLWHCGQSVIVAFHSCLSLQPTNVSVSVASLCSILKSTVLIYLSYLSVAMHHRHGLLLLHLYGLLPWSVSLTCHHDFLLFLPVIVPLASFTTWWGSPHVS